MKVRKVILGTGRKFVLGAAVVAVTPGIALAQQPQQLGQQQLGQQQRSGQGYWADWPQASKEAAAKMYEKYGEPSGVTPQMVVWHDPSPWKMIIVHKDPVPHKFPKPHEDVLEQSVNYEVPTDKFDDLAEFDGSVFAKRTSGVLGTTCDKEPMNILTLNLAHDIITDKKTVEEARQSFGEIAAAFMKGEKHPYTQSLKFDTAREATGDPGEPVIGDASAQKLSQPNAGEPNAGSPDQ